MSDSPDPVKKIVLTFLRITTMLLLTLLFPGRLFPPELFEMFIDIGHYVRDIAAYAPLQESIAVLSVNQ